MTTQAIAIKRTPKEIALFALEELIEKTKTTDKNSHYLQLQIHPSDESRIYVCKCPIMPDYVVINEEYDSSQELANVRVMKIGTFKSYIENLHDIVLVCSNLTDNYDGPFTAYYSKFHKIGI